MIDFPIHIDTISMGWPIVYFKGPHVEQTLVMSALQKKKYLNFS